MSIVDASKTDSPNARELKHRHLQAEALFQNGGGRAWKHWKASALADVIEIAQRAPRLDLLRVDLRGDLDLIYRICQPVPRWPRDCKLVVGQEAIYHLVYQEQWLTEAPLGWLPLGLFEPFDVFHPNAREALRGALCLGHLPPAVAVKELLLKGYFMLCLIDYTLSEYDPNGVLNAAACEFFRAHPEYLPLTRAGLYDPWAAPEGGF